MKNSYSIKAGQHNVTFFKKDRELIVSLNCENSKETIEMPEHEMKSFIEKVKYYKENLQDIDLKGISSIQKD